MVFCRLTSGLTNPFTSWTTFTFGLPVNTDLKPFERWTVGISFGSVTIPIANLASGP